MNHPADIVAKLRNAGVLGPGPTPEPQRLTGGVSSLVYRVETPRGPICVKQALDKLAVAADWRAPIERSHYEAEWLRFASAFAPGATPEVLFEDRTSSLFAMTFFDPETHPVWKTELAEGGIEPAFAARIGGIVGAIHAGAAGRRDIADAFPTNALFEALRLEPYLRHTAAMRSEHAGWLIDLADRTAAIHRTLVHGDVSPKNILCGPGGPIILDAECAWYGDPAFDLAFCTTHLLLKAVWRPLDKDRFLLAAEALREAYRPHVAWEPWTALQARAAELVCALLLARVDGKSPVEYLSEAERRLVRWAADGLVHAGPRNLADVSIQWRQALEAK